MMRWYVACVATDDRELSLATCAISPGRCFQQRRKREYRSSLSSAAKEPSSTAGTCIVDDGCECSWLQNKGDVEEIAKRTGFDCISIFRPGATIKKDAEGLSGLLLNSVSNPLSVKAIVHASRLEAGSTSFVIVM